MSDFIRLAKASDRLALVQFGTNLLFFVAVILLEITFHEWRVHGTGSNAVHADFRRVVHRQLTGHCNDSAFGTAISEAFLHADNARDRTEVHDAAVGGLQKGHTELCDQVESAHINAEDAVEIVSFGFFHTAHEPDSGIVHKDVELADGGDSFADSGFVRNIKDAVRSAGEFGSQFFRFGFVDVDDHNTRARSSQDARGLFANAAGAACDQRCFSVNSERCHRVNCNNALNVLNREIVECTRCPRLIRYCREVAVMKRRAYMDWEYCGRPVPSFGDPAARLLILGLAPGAHGANRTGRMFTGDRSGDFLYRSLYRAGFASQPESLDRSDGLELRDAWISASAHCAPPDNKPSPAELRKCRPYFERELKILTDLRVVVVLGKIALDTYLAVLKAQGVIDRVSPFRFGHDALYTPGGPALLCSYHPSQQNTSTGKLTQDMLDGLFLHAAEIIRSGPVPAEPRP